MSLVFLLDTDICIHMMRYGTERLTRRSQLGKSDFAGISTITHGELLTGAAKSRDRAGERQKISEFLRNVPVLNLPPESASVYGDVRARLEARGEIIGNNDLWIAAHAIAAGLTLVTNNEREFRRVRGLKVENWTK